MKDSKDIVKEIEAKADQFGMSNTDVADKYANAIPQIQSIDIWHESAKDSPAYKRDVRDAEKNKEKIVNLFKNELDVDATDAIIWKAALQYAKKYATIKNDL